MNLRATETLIETIKMNYLISSRDIDIASSPKLRKYCPFESIDITITATDVDGDGSIDMQSADADLTGRNFAAKTFDKIEQNIADSFSILANPKDEDMFTDYLLTNLKLYFDKYEDELRGVVAEPSTAEYEDEVSTQDAEDTSDELGGEEPIGDEEDEEGIDIALQELFFGDKQND